MGVVVRIHVGGASRCLLLALESERLMAIVTKESSREGETVGVVRRSRAEFEDVETGRNVY